MGAATKQRTTEFVHGSNFVHHITEDEAAQRLSAIVVDLSEGQLARATKKTKDTAKSWKAKRRCPHLASALNLGRQFPEVKAWIIAEMGGPDPDFYAPGASAIIDMIAAEVAKRSGQ